MKNEFDYGFMPDLISQTLSDRVFRGMQDSINRNYNRKHRVSKSFVEHYGNSFTFKIRLPNGNQKKYKVQVKEIK